VIGLELITPPKVNRFPFEMTTVIPLQTDLQVLLRGEEDE
jgi:hypothetical protein